MDEADVRKLLHGELMRIGDGAVRREIESLLVEPYCVEREWDYGPAGQKFPCWTVLEHPASNTAIAYCSQGFGPANPWGLVFLSGPYMSIGADYQWYSSLEDAFRQSQAWTGENPPGYEIE